jgi:hypothetical protein
MLVTLGSFTANGIQFVDEDDGRLLLAGGCEEVAHTLCTDADEHFLELGTRGEEEWDACLSGDGPGEHGLSGAGWTCEQDTFWELSTEGSKGSRVSEKGDDVCEFLRGVRAARGGEGGQTCLTSSMPCTSLNLTGCC